MPDKTAVAEEPQTFPQSLEEFALASGIGPVVKEGLRVFVLLYKVPGEGDRFRAEWETLLAEFMARPVTC
jgi:hypothetical protein